MAALAPALGKLVSLTSLNLGRTYAPSLSSLLTVRRRVWWGCAVEVCWHGDAVQVVTLCMCGVVAGNALSADGMEALAPALSKLVSLTSLDLHST